MDVKEYIASGVLELYALGTLPAAEMKEVERMAEEHPEVAFELRQIQDAVGGYTSAFPQNPHPAARSEVMRKIRLQGPSKGRVLPLRSPHELTYKYLIAACIASLIISTFASIFFYQKWSDAEDRRVAMSSERNKFYEEMKAMQENYAKVSGEMATLNDIIHNQAVTIVTLNAMDSVKYYKAHVYWNKYTRQTWIDVIDLPTPASDRQYQLWALVGGQPVDAGVFNIDNSLNMQRMKQILNADAWAVTLEPKGGSASPTMDQMYLMSRI